MDTARHHVDGRFAHCTTTTTVTVVDAAGAPGVGREAIVDQKSHAFGSETSASTSLDMPTVRPTPTL